MICVYQGECVSSSYHNKEGAYEGDEKTHKA